MEIERKIRFTSGLIKYKIEHVLVVVLDEMSGEWREIVSFQFFSHFEKKNREKVAMKKECIANIICNLFLFSFPTA